MDYYPLVPWFILLTIFQVSLVGTTSCSYVLFNKYVLVLTTSIGDTTMNKEEQKKKLLWPYRAYILVCGRQKKKKVSKCIKGQYMLWRMG